MPKMSFTDGTIHAAQDLIHALNNTAPGIPLVVLVNSHMVSLRILAEIFVNATSLEIPPRVAVSGAYKGKFQQINKE